MLEVFEGDVKVGEGYEIVTHEWIYRPLLFGLDGNKLPAKRYDIVHGDKYYFCMQEIVN